MDTADTLDKIRYWHRQRVFAMDQRKRSDLALGSFLRLQLGWTRDGDAEANDSAMERAAAIIDTAERLTKEQSKSLEKRKPVSGLDDVDFVEWQDLAVASIIARSPFADLEAKATKQMEKLAETLPIWSEFGEPIKGFGARSLAVVLAETGDLSNYANPGKVWKRMGLAVMDGVRQGGLRKNAAAEEWIAHGYSAKRRSQMYVIGDTLIKNQSEYRELYLERLAIEHAKAIADGLIPATSTKATVESWEARGLPPLTKVSKIDPAKHRGAGHMAHRAQRYMEKRLLRNLWQAWRKAASRLEPTDRVPSSDSFQKAA